MVRNYIRKTTRGEYTRKRLQECVEEIRAGETIPYTASKQSKIPLTTLLDHVHKRRGLRSTTLGRSTEISPKNEKRFVKCILTMEKYNFTLSRRNVKTLVAQFVKENNIVTQFKDGIPGQDWCMCFTKRHNLSLKKQASLEASRKTIDERNKNYYSTLESTIFELGLENDSTRIWNVDEVSFWEDIPVLLAASAAGDKVPPFILFQGKTVNKLWQGPSSVFRGTTYNASENGKIDAGKFQAYFKHCFLRSIGSERPVLLLYHGPINYISFKLIEMATEARVTILKIPPACSEMLQPLGQCISPLLKTMWQQELQSWKNKTKHATRTFSKCNFSKLVAEIWRDLHPEIIKNAYLKSSIFPVIKNHVEATLLAEFLQIKREVDSHEEGMLPLTGANLLPLHVELVEGQSRPRDASSDDSE